MLQQPAYRDAVDPSLHDAWLNRTRAVNRLSDVQRFIRRWDGAPEFAATSRQEIRRSAYGNLNSSGTPADSTGAVLPYWHPQFLASVEEGVRPLVLALTMEGRWISYTSCEGHDYRALGLPSLERHVGLLPRTAQEFDVMADCLSRIVRASRASAADEAYHTGLLLGQLENCAAQDEQDRLWPVIDLCITHVSGASWDAYFARLDHATAELIGMSARVLSGSVPLRRPSCEASTGCPRTDRGG